MKVRIDFGTKVLWEDKIGHELMKHFKHILMFESLNKVQKNMNMPVTDKLFFTKISDDLERSL